jgi:hypothetical protein
MIRHSSQLGTLPGPPFRFTKLQIHTVRNAMDPVMPSTAARHCTLGALPISLAVRSPVSHSDGATTSAPAHGEPPVASDAPASILVGLTDGNAPQTAHRRHVERDASIAGERENTPIEREVQRDVALPCAQLLHEQRTGQRGEGQPERCTCRPRRGGSL